MRRILRHIRNRYLREIALLTLGARISASGREPRTDEEREAVAVYHGWCTG